MEARALIELLDRHDDVIGRYRVGAQALTIGRGLDCDIVVEDPYTAAHHASLRATAEGWDLQLASSVNGAWHAGQRLPGDSQHALPPGAELELGQTRLRLRHPSQALAAEQPLPQEHHRRQSWTRYLPSGRAMLLLGLVCAWNLGSSWLDGPPDSPWSSYFDELLSTLGFAALWGGLWSLINQLFKREMPFWQHLQDGLLAYLVVRGGVLVLSLAAYAFSLPLLSHITGWATTVGVMVACWFCARRIWPKRQKRTSVTLVVLTLLMVLPQAVKLHANQHRWLTPLYMATLAPPALRISQPEPTTQFLQEVKALQAPLLEAAAKDRDKPDETPDTDED
ncbi:MAG: FHA domain-containing protein [Acidobacteriota bacterium]